MRFIGRAAVARFSSLRGPLFALIALSAAASLAWGQSQVLPGEPASRPVSIVFNDADSVDSSLASEIQKLLSGDLTAGSKTVSGVMPKFAVKTVPESSLPRAFDKSFSVPGVIIITPATTLYADDGRSRGIAAQGRGVIAMGTGGALFIDEVLRHWDAWGMTWQAPDAMGWSESEIGALADSVNTLVTDSSVWSTPLASTAIPEAAQSAVRVADAPMLKLDLYWPNPWQPMDGELIAGDVNDRTRYPIVRQGRFLQFGFFGLTDARDTGEVLFVNLVSLMSTY
jgi:hypothetical protein